MKDPFLNIDIENINKEEEKSTQYDISISSYDATSEYLESEEDITEKTIAYIEREIRSSFEYRKYINYLKNELDITRCAMLKNLNCNDIKFSLEFHHYPLNLYEITETIAKQRVLSLGEDEKVSCFDIAEQVMEEHYKGNVGLVPLTETMHKMAHNRSIIVPITSVEGNYKYFLKKYDSYISEDIKDRVKETEFNSISDDAKIYNESKLEKNITNFNIEYLD